LRVKRPIEVVVLNCSVTETKEAPLMLRISDDLGKIGKRAGQPVDLIDDTISTPAVISASGRCTAGRSIVAPAKPPSS
jgi:hypothetical protein